MGGLKKMNDFEGAKKKSEQVVRLTKQIHHIIDTALEEDFFTAEELTDIQEQMTALIEQGFFWLKQENQDRFVYELTNFLKWLVDFSEMKKNS